jgi:hypothetical protein
MRTNLTARNGIYETKSYQYQMSTSVVRYWDITALPGVTVHHVDSLIEFARRGCVNSSEVEGTLVPALRFNYSTNVDPIELAMKPGRFAESS